MKVFEHYFQKNPVNVYPAFPNNPEVIVIIPVLNDWDIFATIDSLCTCTTVEGNVGVIIVVNHGEDSDDNVKMANRVLAEELKRYATTGLSSGIYFEIVEAFDLPAKFAGVGLARKIAMDVAAKWFWKAGKPENPILSLDADTLVEKNYLDEIVRFFRVHPVAGVSVAYEHRLDEMDCDYQARMAMIKYELYLRYYQMALEYTGHPHAFHCIGSAFAVRAVDYVAQGGMNKRQAGEDFYFLQKLIATGRYATLKTTKVYPSPRFSDRTPFGTGRSVQQIAEGQGKYPVYHFDAFRELKYFFDGIPTLFQSDGAWVKTYFSRQATGVQGFLAKISGEGIIAEVNANCASEPQFIKRFYDNFNAFRVLKYLNYVHEEIYQKEDIECEIETLMITLNFPFSDDLSDDLRFLRSL